MSGIGPVEPGESTTLRGPADVDVIGPETGAPRLSDRWAALPRGRRRAAVSVACATVLAALAGYAVATRPAPPEPPPPPWPAQATRFTYEGPGRDTPDRATRTFTLRFTVSVTEGPPVTVREIRLSSESVTTVSAPATPFTVEAGSEVPIVLRFHVRDCRGVPREVVLAFLDVTLRNTRAIQQESYIIGGDYPQDLFTALRRSCGNSSQVAQKHVAELGVLSM
jgi:hypothetical protein